MKKVWTMLVGAALAVFAHTGFAQGGFPERPVRLLVPFPPGAATDLAARTVAQQLQQILGTPVVVDNKPGANGSIAGIEVVRAPADGYTLLFSSNSAIAANVALLKSMPYDPLKDFTPIAGVGENPLVLMVKADFPAGNLKEFVAHLKQRPGQLSAGYGSSSSQVCAAMLNRMSGTDTLMVPYKGIPLALADVMGGTIDLTYADLGNAMAQVKGGKMKALAVTSEKRSPVVPDWPAVSESYPGYDIMGWFGIVGPANLPQPVVDKLAAATLKAVALPEVQARFAQMGMSPMPKSPLELKAYLVSEVAKWKRLVKEANITPE